MRLAALLVFVLSACLPDSRADSRPPNVVLFLVDDMGWMDSTPYGSEYYETPEMERLAAQSMRFTDAYAVPLCSPSRATILTGQYSSRHGLTSASGHRPAAEEGESRYEEKAPPQRQFLYPKSKNYLDPAIPNLATVLREAGYRTGHFGKWHLGIAPEHRPDRQGFDDAWYCVPDPGPPSYFSPYGVQTEGNPGGQNKIGTVTDGPEGEYITDRLTDEAIAFLEANRDRPFFLNLWQYGVHGPWGHKEEITRRFAEKTDPRGEQRNPIMASMLKSVDESLGRILDTLEELGLAENTLFIFYSDNGGNTHSNTPDSRQMQIGPSHPKFAFKQDWKKWAGPEPPTNNAPLREGKGRIYEGGQRVPLLVRWPGQVEAGSLSDAIVGPIDLYPTILAATGVKAPWGHVVDGESILPVLRQQGSLERDTLFTWFPHLIPAASVRQGDWKLIYRWEPHAGYPATRELYDLGKDIGETTNLAREMPEKVADLEARIESFIEDTGALAPKPNPDYRPDLAKAMRARDFGLVPKMAETSVEKGFLRVEKAGRTPFLGTGQLRTLTGPLTLRLVMRGPAGEIKVHWKTERQETFPPGKQLVTQDHAGGAFAEIVMTIPVEGNPGTLRLYLPATDEEEVAIRSIRFEGAGGASREWNFAQ